jgi:GH24 family phage-related lysozyme (muramidase)
MIKETGIGISSPLFFIGVVENNVDERLEKRVQVRAFGVHGTVEQVPTENLPWATLIFGNYDPNAPVPPVNSFVFGFFVDGRDAQQPMILGMIPTQFTEMVDPAVTGWGSIPTGNGYILGKGSTPLDIGQPANSRLERGEYIDETYVLLQEMNRRRNIAVAKSSDQEKVASFEEPTPAYNAQYPYNRVIETSSHSIELDDTPGAERITIWHKSGSYVSIDTNGTTVQKSMSDRYDINESHQHVYVGGKNLVTIEGDSRVLVKGNKVEEIVGDYIQVVHGNHMLSVAGQMNLNASDEVQMRAAKLRLEANVEGINLRARKKIRFTAGERISISSAQDITVKGVNLYLTADSSGNIKAKSLKLGGGDTVDINADTVSIDDIVRLAPGDAASPETLTPETAESSDMPEPTQKDASMTANLNSPSVGSVGYTSQDDLPETRSSGLIGADPILISAANPTMGLLELIKAFEGFSEYPYRDGGQWSIGYGTGVGSTASQPRIPGPISVSEAEDLLSQSLGRFIVNVDTIDQLGNYNWSQESKEALTSFAYNIGSINELTANGTRDNQTIANKMLEYINADGKPLSGLLARRKIEREKFLSGLGVTT